MKLLKSILAIALLPLVARCDISWGTGANTAFNSDGTTPLVANRDDAVGYFVQLINAGPNGTVDLVNLGNPTGVGGDDFVVDVAWFGASTISATAGKLTSQGEAHVPGHTYYVRAWNAPSPSAVVGTTTALQFSLADGNEGVLAPLATATFYGNSAPLTTPVDGNSSDPITFNFGLVTNQPVLIPEPTSFGLLGMGFAGMMMALKRRRLNRS
jgi:hypothetical protein